MKKKALVSLAISLCLLAVLALAIRFRKGGQGDSAGIAGGGRTDSTGVAAVTPETKAELAAEPDATKDAEGAEEAEAAPKAEIAPLLRGRVTGEGAPIANASVRLFGVKRVEQTIGRLEEAASQGSDQIPDVPRIIRVIREELEELKGGAILSRTGPDGVYEFRGIEADSYVALTVADGWLFRYGDVASLSLGTTQTVDIALERGATISGRVVDGSGRGLPGITVLAEYRPAGTAGLGKIARRLLRLVNGEFLRGPFEARTADDGSFTHSSLLPGIYDIAAIAPSGIEGRLEGVETGSEDALVYLGKEAAVKGAFLDASANPAGGAVFFLEREDDGVTLEGPMAMWGGVASTLERELGGKPQRHEAGPRGDFHLKALSAGKYKLSVPGGGYLPLSRSFALDWGQTLDLGALALDAGDSVSGTVRGEDGRPLEGARVRLTASKMTFFNMGNAVQDIVSGEKTTRTGPSGQFRIAGLVQGEYRLVATAQSCIPEVRKSVASGETVEIELRRGARIEGRVLEAGTEERPIAEARVRCGQMRTRTDAEGRFVLDGVAAENPEMNPFAGLAPAEGPKTVATKVEVGASAPGFIRSEVHVDLASPGAELELRLGKAPEIRGRVLDPDGQPLPGALTRLTFHLGEEGQFIEGMFDRTLIFSGASVTDLEGEFRFTSYRQAGEWQQMQVVADHPLHARGMSGPIEVAEGKEPPAEVEIRLERAARIQGTVTDGTNPVRGAAVRLLKKRAPQRGGPDMGAMLSMFGLPKGGDIVYARAEGAFAHEKVLPGDYVLVAEAPGYGDSPQAQVTLAAGEERELVLALERGGELFGVVVDAGAAPIANARVRVLREPPEGADAHKGAEAQVYQTQKVFGGALKSARTDGDGRFTVRGLPPGTYTVMASRSGFTAGEIEGATPGGDERRIVLQRAAALRGLVRDAANGEPIPRFRVTVTAAGLPFEQGRGFTGDAREHADPGGSFTREDLEPGERFVTVSSPGFAPVRSEVLLEAGATAEVEFALPQAGRLLGVVADIETGAPIAGARIFLTEESTREADTEGSERPGKKRRGRDSKEEAKTGDADEDLQLLGEHFVEAYAGESVQSGNDGSFRIDDAPAETRTLVASHAEYITEAKEGILVGAGQELQARLALRRGLSCSGVVRDGKGDGSAGAFVFIRGIGEENRHVRKSSISGGEGKFRIGGLEKGSYRIVIPRGDGGGGAGDITKLEIELRDDVSNLELAMPGG